LDIEHALDLIPAFCESDKEFGGCSCVKFVAASPDRGTTPTRELEGWIRLIVETTQTVSPSPPPPSPPGETK
jgi:hypothetical protein